MQATVWDEAAAPLLRELAARGWRRGVLLSAHSDDVALSMPCAVQRMAAETYALTLVTCFTDSRHAPLATRPDLPIAELRRREDERFAAVMGLRTPPVWLTYRDAPMRGIGPEALFSRASLSAADLAMSRVIADDVAPHVDDATVVFAPLAIGGHVDHKITRHAASILARGTGGGLVYYEDLPYAGAREPVSIAEAVRASAQRAGARAATLLCRHTAPFSVKQQAIECYPSQVWPQWRARIEGYTDRLLATTAAAERLWRFV